MRNEVIPPKCLVVSVVKTLPSNKPRIIVYLDQDLKSEMGQLATQLGMSTSELAIEAFETFLRDASNPETIKIRLPLDKQEQLKHIARDEYRSMEDQASVIIDRALEDLETEQ